jgi:hypothetical protein
VFESVETKYGNPNRAQKIAPAYRPFQKRLTDKGKLNVMVR